MKKTEVKTIRCAVYTRKSTEEGLEQDFNSLHAQREAAESYIKSQKSEGWVCLPEQYDDGGFSGGNMERPALRRLLEDIEAGHIDCLVVYKVDRLSRSLIDFTKILTRLEKKQVSFVSVTQHFNTTTSMGRLTLNILLSFAQFEREVISERTRDKIALARKRGKWSGGRPVLGYDISPGGGELNVNEAEAEQVRKIFALYLEHGGLLATIAELDRRNWQTKTWVTRKGKLHRGRPFNKNSLYNLLKNPVYIGKIRHHEQLYEGEQDGIVDGGIFQRVQRLLGRNRMNGRSRPRAGGGILNGILRCKACGCGMSHSYTKKNSTRYRYYVCQNAQVRGWAHCPRPSLPADEIERFVVQEIRNIGQDEKLIGEVVAESRRTIDTELAEFEKRYRLLCQELARENRELKSLAATAAHPETAQRLAAIQDKIRGLEQHISECKSEITRLKQMVVSARDIRDICRSFDPLWDTLTQKEQWRMLSLLIGQVEYDDAAGSISLAFQPGGVQALNAEMDVLEAGA